MRARVLIHGPLACFTRPEMKVERMSYPVMTPSAARGVLEAILYKPQFRWRVRYIHVLKPIKLIGLRRNEVKEKGPGLRTLREWMAGKPVRPILADATEEQAGDDKHGRTQRNTVALKDVAYVIDAEVWGQPGTSDSPTKYYECFMRRVERGQCFTQPVLGCREFVGYFERAPDHFSAIAESRDLGLMLYDVFDLDADNDGYYDNPFITLFSPSLENGVMKVEDWADVKARYVRGGHDA
jgi:CRISPR-associated protein Cas5d